MISDTDCVKHATAAPAVAGEKTSASSDKDHRAPPAAPNIVMSSKDHDSLFSGGGISFLSGSRNGRINYGYSSFKGKRSSMEDFFETKISEVDGQMVAFFGVFDGHGGSRTAEYLKNNLFKNLSNHPGFIKDTKTAISVPLSVDHKPDRSDERQRIEQAGGFIIWAGTWRVGGVLAVSRAFGDKLLKPYVVADPEIQEEEIEGVDFIIIASDGLWNVISNKEAVSLVQTITDAEVASRELIKEAYTRGSSDNITCVVVRFDPS
ncbi:probable protein phosphatase 2C 11 isoform X2 [Cicer arietinum]|uniref:protein-serine/threonine phosphatase n=1 Tax=Cicer arietinum TaxID=3827 RepID=A0A3Q7YAN3_CICAR|nr:probable protein phosphatase 2C 11 isoform X2 [Cicer arietinum]